MIRTGHLVQDFRGGSTVTKLEVDDWIEYEKNTLEGGYGFPYYYSEEASSLAGTPLSLKSVPSCMSSSKMELLSRFLIKDSEVCWGRKELLEEAKSIPPGDLFCL